MEQVIEKARQRLLELEEEALRLRTFIGVYEDLSGQVREKNASPSPESGDLVPFATPAQIVESAREAMRELSRPLSRSRLVKVLTERGLRLPGEDKAKNVGTVIWRSKQFDNIAGEGYWPKDFARWMGQRPRSDQFSLA